MPDLKFFADEQISRAVILGLKQRGVDIVSTYETVRSGLSDESHIVYCKENGYVLLTEDQDFLALAISEPDHSGIIYARQFMSIGSVVRGVLLIAETLGPDDMASWVEYLQPDR